MTTFIIDMSKKDNVRLPKDVIGCWVGVPDNDSYDKDISISVEDAYRTVVAIIREKDRNIKNSMIEFTKFKDVRENGNIVKSAVRLVKEIIRDWNNTLSPGTGVTLKLSGSSEFIRNM